ncbi:MAG: SWIM zinc finger family protein [Sandaracinus sp.]|nr:SWIM zinc finger family protein [Sandaracinus sp.]MCB9612126.1 SWIM zinc finger family protein [Sandaracinus sp.]MCB9636276.1 SWIM zinc finger family protein [Sandaracinus sp.]
MRADLLALTPESVASLANWGLVKRALKEIDAGQGPSLAEEDDGTVVGTFGDGTVARLSPGLSLRDTRCSCPATGVCRHRVATALAYPAFAKSTFAKSLGGEEDTSTHERTFEAWSPGEIADEALEGLGRRTLDEAKTARRRGLVAVVRRASVDEPTPSAELPSCTVRFLVPRDLAYARCDCRLAQGCSHVVLAVWAFREADVRDASASELTVELRDAGARADEHGPLDDAVGLARHLVVDGVTHAREALSQRFERLRRALASEGHVWPEDALEDLERALARYRSRSARYRAEDVLAIAAELEARRRASRRDAALPAAHVLGTGEKHETALDHLRLVGLGARVEVEGPVRRVEVFLGEPDTGAVLVCSKEWSFEPPANPPVGAVDPVPDGPSLGRRKIAGATFGQLAAGQVVSRAAKRRANRAITFGSAHGSTSVVPQTGDWDRLPAPLRAGSVQALLRQRADRPPRFLRPRVLAEDLHVLPVAEVLDVRWEPAEQALLAAVSDPEGGVFTLVLPHRSVSPDAGTRLAYALSGAVGKVRFVAGEVSMRSGGLVMQPTALACDRVIVPALVGKEGDDVPLEPGALPRHHGGPFEALASVTTVLAEGVQVGLRDLGASGRARLGELGRELSGLGLVQVAARVERARLAVETARTKGDDAGWDAAAGAWLDAAIRVSLAWEAAAAPAEPEV